MRTPKPASRSDLKPRTGALLRIALIIGIAVFLFKATFAQGTIQTGFEEYPFGSVPPFVKMFYPSPQTRITDGASTIPVIQPFEGQKFLYALGAISLQSPDGLPIQSFTLHVYHLAANNTVRFLVAGQVVPSSRNWQMIQGSFSTPVDGISFSALDMEAIPDTFAIDDITFTTVPEPKTYWLLTLGLGAILLRRSKSLKTQSGSSVLVLTPNLNSNLHCLLSLL